MENNNLLEPINNKYREFKSLDGIWYIKAAEAGSTYRNGVPKERTIPVPANIKEIYKGPQENEFIGEIWYEKSTHIPADWLGQKVYMRFEAVSQRFSVYINGRHVAYDLEENKTQIVDITRCLAYGEENQIVVKLEMKRKSKEIGILKSTSIYTTPTMCLQNYNIEVQDVSKEKASLKYEIALEGNCLVTLTMRNAEHRVVATGIGSNGILTVENPELWTSENAYLYKIDFEVSRLGKTCDAYKINVPIRKINEDEGKLYLNNKEFELKAKQVELKNINTENEFKKLIVEIKTWGYNAIIVNSNYLTKEFEFIADQDGILALAI